MIDKLKIRPLILFTLGISILFNFAVAIAQESLLDGKIFVGQYREKHKSTIEKDELSFLDGRFHSIGYGRKGFHEGLYTARAEENKIYFEAETVNPKQGTIKWKGVVHKDSIAVSYRWSKKGWLSDTEKDYLYNGILKK